MKRLLLLITCAGLLSSCAHHVVQREQPASPPLQDLDSSFSIGMRREEVRAKLAGSRVQVSAARPVDGWSNRVSFPAGGRAQTFETSHPGTTVESCDVYWIGHTGKPVIYYGMW